jgi:hypothetical protein
MKYKMITRKIKKTKTINHDKDRKINREEKKMARNKDKGKILE